MSSPVQPEVNLELFRLSHGPSSINRYLKDHVGTTGMHNKTRRSFLDPNKTLKVNALNYLVSSAVRGSMSSDYHWHPFTYIGDSPSTKRMLSTPYQNPNDRYGQRSRLHVVLSEPALPRIILRKTVEAEPELEFEGPQFAWDPEGSNSSVRVLSPDDQSVSIGVKNYANKTLAFLIVRDALYQV